MCNRTLGDQVVDVVGPVLDGGVANASVLLHNDFHHSRVQRVALVDRCCTSLDVVHVASLVSNDEGSLELTHVFRVDAEVGLERNLNVHTRGHVDEGSTGPHSSVEGSELIVSRRDDGAEVFFEEFGVLFQSSVGVHEDDTLALELFVDLVVNHFRFVLSCHTRNETLALCFRNTELLVGVLDFIGEVFPGLCLTFR